MCRTPEPERASCPGHMTATPVVSSWEENTTFGSSSWQNFPLCNNHTSQLRKRLGIVSRKVKFTARVSDSVQVQRMPSDFPFQFSTLETLMFPPSAPKSQSGRPLRPTDARVDAFIRSDTQRAERLPTDTGSRLAVTTTETRGRKSGLMEAQLHLKVNARATLSLLNSLRLDDREVVADGLVDRLIRDHVRQVVKCAQVFDLPEQVAWLAEAKRPIHGQVVFLN